MDSQVIFPAQKRQKILQKFSLKQDNKIPIVLYFNKQKKWRNLKQYMLVTIEPESSLHQFLQVIIVKLVWSGYLEQNQRTIYLYAKQKQLVINDKKIKSIYEQSKTEDGWLELTLKAVEPFG